MPHRSLDSGGYVYREPADAGECINHIFDCVREINGRRVNIDGNARRAYWPANDARSARVR